MEQGFDATGSYRAMLGVFVVTTLIFVGLMTRIGPYRTPTTVTEQLNFCKVMTSMPMSIGQLKEESRIGPRCGKPLA